jgi:hypothetical protein
LAGLLGIDGASFGGSDYIGFGLFNDSLRTAGQMPGHHQRANFRLTEHEADGHKTCGQHHAERSDDKNPAPHHRKLTGMGASRSAQIREHRRVPAA